MGTFHHPITLQAPDSPRSEVVQALVDTGSTYTMIPAPLLEKLGVPPRWRRAFELADGRREEFDLGEVQVRLDGEERTTLCIFGRSGSEPILGAYTLEGFGLAVDAVNRRLVPARLFLATLGKAEV